MSRNSKFRYQNLASRVGAVGDFETVNSEVRKALEEKVPSRGVSIAHLVTKVGARSMPIKLLEGLRKVPEISTNHLILQIDQSGHFLSISTEQNPTIHVNKLEEQR